MTPLISKTRSRRTRQKSRQAEAGRKARPRRLTTAESIAVLLAWVTAFVLLLGIRPSYHADLMVDQRSPATMVAVEDFDCVDLAATEMSRRRAENAVPPVFTVDMSGYHEALRTMEKLQDRVRAASAAADADGTTSGDELRRDLAEMLDLLGLDTPPDVVLAVLGNPDWPVLETMRDRLRPLWARGIASDAQRRGDLRSTVNGTELTVLDTERDLSMQVALEDVPTPVEAADRFGAELTRAIPGMSRYQEVWRKLGAGWFAPNLTYHPVRTDARRAEAAAAVQPISMHVRSGTTLVAVNERATAQTVEMLAAHEARLRATRTPYESWLRLAGSGFLLLSGALVCLGMTPLVRRRPGEDRSPIYLLVTVSILVLLAVRGLLHLATPMRWIQPAVVDAIFPIALGALLAGILVGAGEALLLGVWISLASAVMFDASYGVLLLGLTSSSVAVLATRHVRRRHHVLRAGLLVGLANIVVLVGLDIPARAPLSIVLLDAVLGLSNGLACSIVALLLVPVLEVLFGRHTDIRLLELSDPSHPLLQRLAIEAPGTYHHSLMVANLAQRAADAIGANGLLARVCAYYHDIGKLSKPEFFTENNQNLENPHDSLSPNMSTLVILSHVKEGVGLALRYKLPEPVIDAIREHHGTGTVSYFYHRALQQGDQSPDQVRQEDFRYPGPKPASKEMAILALADSVEAASRSLEKPTASRVENLVEEIVNQRLQDGQLDNSPLTFQELATIRRTFVFTLTNMLHGRVAYPQNEHQHQQPADKRVAETGAGEGAGRPARSEG